VIEAMRRDKDDPGRRAAVAAALSAAADPPLRLGELAGELAEVGAAVVAGGRDSVRGDAIAGVLLAEAAACGANRLVILDVESPSDPRVARAQSAAVRAANARADALRS
jgi:formiminotetrahydrofolate cyclodeaminase